MIIFRCPETSILSVYSTYATQHFFITSRKFSQFHISRKDTFLQIPGNALMACVSVCQKNSFIVHGHMTSHDNCTWAWKLGDNFIIDSRVTYYLWFQVDCMWFGCQFKLTNQNQWNFLPWTCGADCMSNVASFPGRSWVFAIKVVSRFQDSWGTRCARARRSQE